MSLGKKSGQRRESNAVGRQVAGNNAPLPCSEGDEEAKKKKKNNKSRELVKL